MIATLPLRLLRRLAARLRVLRLEACHGYRIARTARIAPGARFDTRHGGTVEIGDGAQIEDGALLSPHGGRIVVGARAYVGPYAVLYGHGGLTIGEDALVAAQCVLIPASHRFDVRSRPVNQQPLDRQGISVGRDVWLGAGAKVLDGVEIGEGCVVGAGSVVTRSVPPYTVVAGVPAAVLRERP